ncbi:MAG: PAS domain-containing protein [Thermonemataceae bacterium]|nr:PAS domain-containing protein [Thermonemataceae bacterium]
MNPLEKLSKQELIAMIEGLQEAQQANMFNQEDIFRWYDRYKVISKISKEGIWELKIPSKFSPQSPIFYSDEFIRLLGYRKDDFVQELATFLAIINPSQLHEFEKKRLSFFKGQLQDDIFEYELLLLTKKEGYKWFKLKSKLIKGKNKKPLVEIGVLSSIHSKKLVEEALKRGNQTLKYISYASKDGIYDVNLLDYEAEFSENFYLLLGYSPKEVEFSWQNWTDFIHPEDKDSFIEAYNRFLLKKLNAFSKECRMLCQDGSYKWVLNRAKMVQFDEYGVPIRLIGTLTNIQKIKEAEDKLRQAYIELQASKENLFQYAEEIKTTLEQLKQMQEQLVQAEKMASLGVLVAGIAHEINNPISYIYGSVEGLKNNIEDMMSVLESYEKINKDNFEEQKAALDTLKKKLGFDEIILEMKELIENIYIGANQTSEIVKGLRSFSRSNDQVLEETDLKEALETALVLLKNQFKEHIQVEKYYENVPKIWAYPVKISQVFMNLLINAIHAIEAKKNTMGKIIISLQSGKEFVSVKIQDDGIGISSEKQKRIFEPFFTDKEVGKGTGLGLSVSLGIIQSLNGNIKVFSEEGVGSTFEVRLPILRPNQE